MWVMEKNSKAGLGQEPHTEAGIRIQGHTHPTTEQRRPPWPVREVPLCATAGHRLMPDSGRGRGPAEDQVAERRDIWFFALFLALPSACEVQGEERKPKAGVQFVLL